jgi:hypothetical protein
MVSDGISYHTLKFYSPWPVKIYDPERILPYYDGLAIFKPEDYYDTNSFEQYEVVYNIFLRPPSVL